VRLAHKCSDLPSSSNTHTRAHKHTHTHPPTHTQTHIHTPPQPPQLQARSTELNEALQRATTLDARLQVFEAERSNLHKQRAAAQSAADAAEAARAELQLQVHWLQGEAVQAQHQLSAAVAREAALQQALTSAQAAAAEAQQAMAGAQQAVAAGREAAAAAEQRAEREREERQQLEHRVQQVRLVFWLRGWFLPRMPRSFWCCALRIRHYLPSSSPPQLLSARETTAQELSRLQAATEQHAQRLQVGLLLAGQSAGTLAGLRLATSQSTSPTSLPLHPTPGIHMQQTKPNHPSMITHVLGYPV